MLCISGEVAFSAFRKQKLRELIHFHAGIEVDIQAEYIHLINLLDELNNHETAILNRLLSHDSLSPTHLLDNGELTRNTGIVVPRLGTISPWSSKATDIARQCGLKKVQRIERGIAFDLGNIDKHALNAIQPFLHDRMTETFLSNPADLEKLFIQAEPAELLVINVLEQGFAALNAANDQLGLALSKDEIDYLLNHFTSVQRNPSDAELMMFAQANSEHCRHKIFNSAWTIDAQDRNETLFGMIRNTYQPSNKSILSAYKDNAAVMAGHHGERFLPDSADGHYRYCSEDIHILMKVETHNHPTAVSPFPGAATGSGGEIRDEGATGRGAKPKLGLVGFSVSNLCLPELPQPWEQDYGKPDRIASALDIMLTGPIGAAAFNNEFGRPCVSGYFRTYQQRIATAAGEEVRGYHKPIMLAGGLGNIRAGHVDKQALPEGTPVVVLGGPAMLIGLGGGAASSVHSGHSSEALDFASVQRGNPEMQRRCQEVIDRCWGLAASNPILSIHDVGAGGLSNAIPEIIHDAGRGGELQLRQIPNADRAMSPKEIWCNEAQERYVLAIAQERLTQFIEICERERCPYAVVGEATETQQLRVNDTHFNNHPVDMPLPVLLGKPPKMLREVTHEQPLLQPFDTSAIELNDAVQRVLQLPAVADKTFLITIGDRSVGGLVARDQMVGPWQIPVADVAVSASGFNAYTGEAMAMGERTPIALLDARAAARMAVAEAITNIAAADISRLDTLCLSANWMAAAGHHGEDAALFDAVAAVGLELCPALGIAIPVGKDSLSMKTVWQENNEEKSVTAPLSLIISAFAPVQDIRRTLTPQLRLDQDANVLILIDLGRCQNRLGGSALAQVYNQLGERPPDLDQPDLLTAFFNVIQTLNQRDLLLAYHDRSDGGLLATLVEMAFAAHCGIHINLDPLGDDVLSALFNEELGAVIQIRKSNQAQVLQIIKDFDLADCCHVIGRAEASDRIVFEHQQQPVYEASRDELQRYWSVTSYQLQALRDNPECAREAFAALSDSHDPGLQARLDFDPQYNPAAPFLHLSQSPRIAILREQGVNGQIEMAAAFDRAGFAAIDVHMSDIIEGRISLADFQGLVACGGFSYGDVLGAGAGWAKSILFNTRAYDEFAAFFQRPDSFALGVCNGCQMLSTLRELIPGAEHWPQFVRNRSEQFEARLSLLEVLSSPSLFFQGMEGSILPCVIAHGEGRARFNSDVDLHSVESEKLISLRFVDNYAQVAQTYPANPNGSAQAITGLTTNNGRVTIMMPHPERVFRSVQMSWRPEHWGEDSPWLRMFRNARAWLATS